MFYQIQKRLAKNFRIIMSINNNYVMNFLKYKKLLSKIEMINKKFFHDFYNKNK